MEPRSLERGNQRLGMNANTVLRASMEPRSLERGNAPDLRKPRRCEISFNGATFTRTWKLAPFGGKRDADPLASMEPRSLERGNTFYYKPSAAT